MQIALLTAVRTIVRADSNTVRQAYFSTLRKTSLPVRAVCWLYDLLGRTGASTLLVSAYGLKSWLALEPSRKGHSRVLSVAAHANARRYVEQVASVYGADHVDRLRTETGTLLRPASLLRLSKILLAGQTVRRFFRLVRRIDRRRDVLISCRVASALGCYARSKTLLSEQSSAGVLVSSASNPEEVGLVAAARSLCIPTIFVSHAYTTSVSPPLNFSLSILEGEAAVEAHARKGTVGGSIFLAGIEGISHPMEASRLQRPKPVIGIFPPKVVAWPVLSSIIDDCRRTFGARQVIIRWHPSMIGSRKLVSTVSDVSGIVETPQATALPDVAAQCDWVVADAGSNVHLQVLKMGIPTIAVVGMGVHHADQYGFVAARVVFPPIASLRDLPLCEAMTFYSGEWAARFQRYDASYLRAADALSAGLNDAIDAVLQDRPARPPHDDR